MKTLSLGFSSCPNDTFIFDALIHRKIDAGDLRFDVIIEDVETLNRLALEGRIDIVKVSYHAYMHLQTSYVLLNAGSALGHGCGPLLIARENVDVMHVPDSRIGIPGKFTTANLLLQLYAGRHIRARSFLFSRIEDALLHEEIDAGVIIHESRFTYEAKGLKCISDLGAFWEDRFQLPIPLGCIVAHHRMGPKMIAAVDASLRRSVQFALSNPRSSDEFVRSHAREMQPDIIQKHIDLYVTDYTIDLGATGKMAVDRLRAEFNRLSLQPLDKR